jgi:thiol-disulfide isomerase/thioredoxin
MIDWCSQDTFFLILIVTLLIYYYYNNYLTEGLDNNKNQSVSVKVYNFNTEWCGYSVRFQPIWKQLEDHYLVNKSVEILDIKCDDPVNEEKCINYKVEGFPTVILEKSNGNLVEYTGNRSVEDIIKFIESNRI